MRAMPEWRVPAKWVGLLTAVILIGWFLDWNENRSPWGRDIHAAKIEMLKKQLCN